MERRRDPTGPASDEIPRRPRGTGLVCDNQADLDYGVVTPAKPSRALHEVDIRATNDLLGLDQDFSARGNLAVFCEPFALTIRNTIR